MKQLLILIVCFYFVQIASAMDDNTRRINAIKVDTTFLYADVTMHTQKEAISHANELLRQEIQAWAGYLPSNWGDEAPEQIEIPVAQHAERAVDLADDALLVGEPRHEHVYEYDDAVRVD